MCIRDRPVIVRDIIQIQFPIVLHLHALYKNAVRLALQHFIIRIEKVGAILQYVLKIIAAFYFRYHAIIFERIHYDTFFLITNTLKQIKASTPPMLPQNSTLLAYQRTKKFVEMVTAL